MPSFYVKPLATSHALNLWIFPLESHFILYIHLQPTVFAPLVISSKSRTLLVLRVFLVQLWIPKHLILAVSYGKALMS
jgi:hypothetical protein